MKHLLILLSLAIYSGLVATTDDDLYVYYLEINGYTCIYTKGAIDKDDLEKIKTEHQDNEIYMKSFDARLSLNGDLDGDGDYDSVKVNHYHGNEYGYGEDSFGSGSEVEISTPPNAFYVSSYHDGDISYGSDSEVTQFYVEPWLQSAGTSGSQRLHIDHGYSSGVYICFFTVIDKDFSGLGLSDGDSFTAFFTNEALWGSYTKVTQKAYEIDSTSSDEYELMLTRLNIYMPDYYDEIVDDVLSSVWDGTYGD
ncbi:hypothetical protein [Rubellicoccus peritrichatus]|uniref:Uncharacterized protein n=1 Tax=Rubellicoccus peritrichatus TaxID=3080537 RepID=A0AAQ3QUR2_9BACT|nr:hypothetical protein [Puniceicoccus sp. CR14]WOO42661.1 hypothetical protein RZN69_06120 [Puniceicoccus sp. CR14]